MVIIDFINGLPSEMQGYEIDTIWKCQYHCPVCDKFYELENEGRSCKTSEFYRLDVEDCTILLDRAKITITYTEHGGVCVCKSCEDKEQPVNLFEKTMTKEKQMELSKSLAGFSKWYEKHYEHYDDEDRPDDEFQSDLKNLYLMEKMLEIGIL